MIDFEARIRELLPKLEGWCTVEKGIRLAELTRDTNATSVVELGVFGGRSLVALALGTTETYHAHVLGIDPFTPAASLEGANDVKNDEWWSKVDYEKIYNGACAAISNNGLAPRAAIKRAKSLDVVAEFADRTIDIMHQDSNHSEAVSCAEVRAWVPKLRLGGFWVMDDIGWATTRRAQELLEACGFRVLENHGGEWAIYQSVGARPVTVPQ